VADWQRDGNLEPALLARHELDAPAVRGGDRPDDGEPEPVAAGRSYFTGMYQVQSSGALARTGRILARRHAAEQISRVVVLLGLTSLFTDISSEMVSTVLPIYLVSVAGFSPLQYGVIDGIYRGGAALIGIAGGWVSDRFHRHKEVATAGYGLSALMRVGLLAVGSAWTAFGAIVLVDRVGKGVRTAPRDAMISMSSRPETLGASFGVHRALDTTGALIGPLIAFGLLAVNPQAFTSVWVLSLCAALVGVGILVLLVHPPRRERDARPARETASPRAALALVSRRGFRGIAICGTVLGLVTAGDALLYLTMAQRVHIDTSLFPLLFVGTALAYMTLAVPAGRLADRVGRGKVFIGGHVLLLASYLVVLGPDAGATTVALALGLLGTYYAATDGVLAALTSAIVPEALRGTGLSVLTTATGSAKLVASIVFGALWAASGATAALTWFAIALALAVCACALPIMRSEAAR